MGIAQRTQEIDKANEEFDRMALVGGASTPTARQREGRQVLMWQR